MAEKDKASPAVTEGYVFKGGLVWKGGVNPSVSKITERPPPPEPLGTTGGVKPQATRLDHRPRANPLRTTATVPTRPRQRFPWAFPTGCQVPRSR